MRHSRRLWPAVLGVLVLALSCLVSAVAGDQLLVSAATSLEDALREIGEMYRRESGVEITHNFGGSGTLQKQIENGAPADIFIAAAAAPIDVLEKQDLLHPGSRTDLLANTLVLITSKDRPDIQSFSDLTGGQVKYIAIGEPRSVPAGIYAMQCLSSQNLAPHLGSKLVRLLNVRQALAAVATGNADAGMVYRTDAARSPKVRIVAAAPPGSHQPIVYPMAIVRRSGHLDAARKYLAFLRTEAARTIFEKHGFSVAR